MALAIGCVTAQAAVIANQGWQVQDRGGSRTIVMSASVSNEGTSPQSLQVKFALQSADVSAATKTGGEDAARWTMVDSVTSGVVSVPGRSSTVVTASLPSDKMSESGKAYRLLAEAYRPPATDPVGSVYLTNDNGIDAVGGAWLAGGGAAFAIGGMAAGVVAGTVRTSGHPGILISPIPIHGTGSGTMQGTHTATRAGGQWAEHGSGTMLIQTATGALSLSYTYTSSGATAGSLSATSQGSGTFTTGGNVYPVSSLNGSAKITFAGSRAKSGTVITRSGGTAAGTFTGTVGGQAFAGVLNLTNGTQTLNTATGQGTHTFNISISW